MSSGKIKRREEDELYSRTKTQKHLLSPLLPLICSPLLSPFYLRLLMNAHRGSQMIFFWCILRVAAGRKKLSVGSSIHCSLDLMASWVQSMTASTSMQIPSQDGLIACNNMSRFFLMMSLDGIVFIANETHDTLTDQHKRGSWIASFNWESRK